MKLKLIFIFALILMVFACSSDKKTPETEVLESDAAEALADQVEEGPAEEARLAEEAATAKAAKEARLTEKVRLAEKARLAEQAAIAKAAEEVRLANLEKLAEEEGLSAKKAANEKAAAIAKAAADKAIAEFEGAVDKAAADKAAAAMAAAVQALACQETYNLSQEKYRVGKYEETVVIMEELLQMDGCDEEISSKAQYYIGRNYGNKLFKPDKAREAYQKAVDNYTSDLKFVEKSEEMLAHYSISDKAKAAYDEGNFQKAIDLSVKVAQLENGDKELRAKNQLLAGNIYLNKLNNFDGARKAYQILIDDYTGSKYVAMAKKNIKTVDAKAAAAKAITEMGAMAEAAADIARLDEEARLAARLAEVARLAEEAKLETKGDLTYKSGSEEPFTGKQVGKNAEGQKLWEKEYEGGRLVAHLKYNYEYFDNGQKKDEGIRVDGEYRITNRWASSGALLIEDGVGKIVGRTSAGLEVWRKFYEGGIIAEEWTFEYEYHENNTLKSKTAFQDGSEIGESTTWFDNGQKKEEGIRVDGEYRITNRWTSSGVLLIEDGVGNELE